MQSLTLNRRPLPLALAATPALPVTSTVLALISTSMATVLAVIMVSDDYAKPGALYYPALIMSVGLAIGPLSAVLRNPKALLRGEALLAIAPIYGLLFDLLQGVFPLEGLEPHAFGKRLSARRHRTRRNSRSVPRDWLVCRHGLAWRCAPFVARSKGAGPFSVAGIFRAHVFRVSPGVFLSRHVEFW